MAKREVGPSSKNAVSGGTKMPIKDKGAIKGPRFDGFSNNVEHDHGKITGLRYRDDGVLSSEVESKIKHPVRK